VNIPATVRRGAAAGTATADASTPATADAAGPAVAGASGPARADAAGAAVAGAAVAGASGPAAAEPAEFRRRLLDGMAEAIAERGFRESTVADVVRHARTSRRTFYEHFASKQACFAALLQDANAELVRQIAAAVDRRAPWKVQIRQAIEAWIDGAQSAPALTLSWIREVPALGAGSRQLQRAELEAFIVLVQTLTDTAELRAAGIRPAPRQFAIILLGGLRELVASTVEDGGSISDITEVAVEATIAMLGPRT
jgi:AcrR family transcriptional regulator